jgi:hypothetical protein
MPRRFQNNFTTTLVDSGGITDTATSMTLAANPTSLSLGAGEFVIFTLINGATREHVRATSVSGTAVSGMTRGVEGTTASAFPAGTTVNIHVTAEWLESVIGADANTTVSISPAVYYHADFTITDATATTAQRVLIKFEPNTDFDLDDLAVYRVDAAVLTNGTITGVISTDGPIGGNFLLSYALG